MYIRADTMTDLIFIHLIDNTYHTFCNPYSPDMIGYAKNGDTAVFCYTINDDMIWFSFSGENNRSFIIARC